MDKCLILKRINESKSLNEKISMRSETDDGLSSCSIFPERPSSYEIDSDKLVLPDIERLRGKIVEGELESLKAILNRKVAVF